MLLFLLLSFLSIGCGKREINDLAMVTAVGFDLGENPENIRVTAQIVRPPDARGQTGAPSGGTGEPIYSITAEGKSIFSAIRNLARFSSRRIFWAHSFIIVVNEDVARRGMTDVLDFFTRNHETRMNTWLVVTPDQASEVVSTVTGLEVVPGEALDKLFRYNEIVAEAPRTNVMRFEESFLDASSHPVLARMHLRERGVSNKKPEQFGSLKQVELSGTAVFKHTKMIGWLDPEESRALLLFIENVESSVVVLPCPDQTSKTKKEVSVELKFQKFGVTPTYKNEEPGFDIRLTTYADLVESECDISLDAMKKELEIELEKKLQDNIHGVIDKAQKEYKVDFLKLGETFNNRYPAEWKKLQPRWEQVFTQATTNVQVKANINSPVLLKLPTEKRKEGDGGS
ncbi:Ger(x)C family spore germination protein [Ammoniphilus sp. CFH 90114]|nr:Ger(x)C family spore germination protein [Ammoniphilus sp. CFH 90114]